MGKPVCAGLPVIFAVGLKKGKLYESRITKYKFPDTGVAKTKEGTALIRGTLPGQKVSFYVSGKRAGMAKGRLSEVLERSSLETEKPACPHFGRCGGCIYQRVAYEDQLKLKADCVKRLIGCEDRFEGIYPSPSSCGYRNKMEYTFGDEYKDGPLALGLHKKGSFYDVVNTSGCIIVHDDFNIIRSAVRGFFAEYYSAGTVDYHHRNTHRGYLRHLLLRRSFSSGDILVALVTTTPGRSDAVSQEGESGLISSFCKMLKNLSLSGRISGAFHVYNDSLSDVVKSEGTELLFGEEYITEEILGLKFSISLFSFFQTNPKGAEVLYSKAREYAACRDGDMSAGQGSRAEDLKVSEPAASLPVIYDLYCGTGTITQLMSPAASRVIGVEIVEEAVETAKKNAVMNGIANAEFIAGDVTEILCGKGAETLPCPDLIILDPPREGVHPKALAKILSFGVRNIIYISCKPTSLASEIAAFNAAGYELRKYACVDMFPHTVHVETVCLLSNRKCASSEPKPELAQDLGERRDSERSLLDFVNLKPDAYVDLSLDMEDYRRIKAGGSK